MDYSLGVSGYKIYDKLETLQNRAIRTFFGGGKSAPNQAIRVDMGWTFPYIRRRSNIIRLWHRIMSVNSNRLPHQIFEWDSIFSKTHKTLGMMI